MAKPQKRDSNPILYVLAGIGAIVVIILAAVLISSFARLLVIGFTNNLTGLQPLISSIVGVVSAIGFLLAIVMIVVLVVFAATLFGKPKK